MMIAPMGWVVIALGGVVLIAGLALFALMIRRKAIPVIFGLALILIVSAVAWLFLAQGRRIGSRGSWVTDVRVPFAEGMAPFSSEWEVEVNREFDKAREESSEGSGSAANEFSRQAKAHRLEAKELAEARESLVITEEGRLIVVPPAPSIPPEAIGPATVHLLTKDHLQKPWLGRSRIVRGGLVWNLVTALSIAAFLFVGYVFLDASTRGHFTWSLRILSVLVLVGVFVTMAALRVGL